MKLKSLLKITAISLTALLASCGDKKDDHAGHDHSDHDGHDHNADDKDDHDHDHDHDHSKCEVTVGPNGGRMIKDIAELKLTADGKLTLAFLVKPADGTKVTILHNGDLLELTQEENTYQSAPISDKLPAEIHIAIKEPAGSKTVEKFKLESGKCAKCKNAKLACICHNDDHDDDHKGHDHDDDHKGHDHDDDHKGHDH